MGNTIGAKIVLEGEKEYREAITIIKNAGYATDPNYVNKIVSIIEANELYKYDIGRW